MTDRSTLTDFRVTAVRIGLVVSWCLLALFTYLAYRDPGIDELGVWAPLSAVGGVLLVLTLLPWPRLLQSYLGDVFIVVWCAAAVTAIVAGDIVRFDTPLVAPFAVVIVAAAAVLVSPVGLGLVSAVALTGYGLALARSSETFTTAEIALRVAMLVAVGLITAALSRAVRRQLRFTSQRLNELHQREDELSRKETDLERLYAVSRTIGAGSNLAEVLPELVGRVVAAVNAKVGLVLMYSAEDQALEVMSPIWVAGHTLRAEGYLLALTDAGTAQRVFVSGEPAVDNDVAGDHQTDQLLADLDAHRVAAVPLRIEARDIGVLMVCDKADGDFDQGDLQTLESLAAPSALVLNQIARYEEAQEAGEKMAELAQLKTDFVSVVSHELRTPLTSIIGSLKTLARPELAPTNPSARELLFSAGNQADRLRALIEDLLVVSRLDNRALPVRPQPVPLRSFLSETLQNIPGAADRVTLDVAADLNSLETDPEHLRRIVTNLVDNGLKYAQGSPIEVTARSAGNEVWISVADHGPGIPYELHNHIFDRFTQVEHAETRARGGTGLGLSIVRGLTEAMAGRVWFEPTIGGGSTFMIALPRTAAAYDPPPEREEASAAM